MYEEYHSVKDETEAPIYNMILDMEAVELHKLSCIVVDKGGRVLDLSTDCVTCTFQNGFQTIEFPFTLHTGSDNLQGYYYDDEYKVPRYKVEHKENDRLKVPKMAQYKRTEKYEHTEAPWNEREDVGDNDFKKYVEMILDSGKSWNIDGRAGTGKSTLIKIYKPR